MGYYTHYKLIKVEEVPDASHLCPACKQPREDVERRPTFREALGDNLRCLDGDSCKWYEHEDHIAAAMKTSGATRVEISGEGEEQGDAWDKVFTLDGRHVLVDTYKHISRRPEKPTSSTRK